MVKRTLMLAAVLCLAVTMGCTTVQKWAAGGAAVGAVIGGVWAGATEADLTAAEGAFVGAAGGGLAGALVGDYMDEQRDKEAMDAMKADYEKQIAALQQENQSLKNQLAAKDQELANANRRIADLQAELDNLRKNARIPAFEISLAADVLFRPGSARLSEMGRKELDDAAAKLTSQYKDKFIMIEGHTDSQPIKSSSWKSNWELGAARSITVLHYLADKGVDPAMLSAATFSKYQPLADNGSKEGMAKNRRAVIVVYSSWPKGPAR